MCRRAGAVHRCADRFIKRLREPQSVDFFILFVGAFDVLIAMGMLRDFWNNFNSEHKSCRVEVIGIN